MSIRTAHVLGAALLCASSALAAQTPRVRADMHQLAFLAGDWSCTHAARKASTSPQPDTAATVRVRNAVDGHWLQLSYDRPNVLHVAGYIGVDRSSGKFVESMVDSYGDYWTSRPGTWSGDTLTFESSSTAGGRTIVYRDLYARRTDNLFLHITRAQRAGKAWVTTDTQTCRRTK